MKYYAIAISNRTQFLERYYGNYSWINDAAAANSFESFTEASQYLADMKQDFSDYGVEVVMVEVQTKISNPPESDMVDLIRSKLTHDELEFLGLLKEEDEKYMSNKFIYKNATILFDEFIDFVGSIPNGYIQYGGLGSTIECDSKLSQSLSMLSIQRYEGNLIFDHDNGQEYMVSIPERREQFWEVLKKLIDDFDDNRGLFLGAGRIAV